MRRSHVGIYVFLCFIAGVLLRSLFVVEFEILYFLATISSSAAFFILVKHKDDFKETVHKSSRARLAIVLLGPLLVLLGAIRVESELLPKCDEELSSEFMPITCINDRANMTTVNGTIVAEPEIRDSGARYTISAQEYRGRILLFASSYPMYEYGDVLSVRCRYESPEEFDGFDYPGFLAKSGIYSLCRRPALVEKVGYDEFPIFTISGIRQKLLKAKSRFQDILDERLTSKESELTSSLVLGNRDGVSKDIKEWFRITGTSHVMAISGMHIMILTVLLYNIFYWLKVPRHKSFFVAIAILLSFVAIVGFRASGIRAVMFAMTAMLGEVIHRPVKPLNLLLFVAVLILMINPLLLVYDVGFQLSFLAVLGLTYLSPILQKLLVKIPNPFRLKDVLIMTLSAQLFTLPWLLYQFGFVSIIAPIVNILVLPVVPFIMGGGLATIFSGIVFGPMAFITGLVTSLFAWYVLSVVELFARVPFAQTEGSLTFWHVVLIYAFVLPPIMSERVREYLTKLMDRKFRSFCIRDAIFFNRFVLSMKRRVTTRNVNRKHSDYGKISGDDSVSHHVYSLDDLDSVQLPTIDETESRRENTGFLARFFRFFKKTKKSIKKRRVVIFLVIAVLSAVFMFVWASTRYPKNLEVVFFDIGQGDGYLIRTPGGQNILVDGGPTDAIVRKLENYLPITERTIDLVVLTHPHADHVSGLAEVFERYDIKRVLFSDAEYDTDTYFEFRNMVDIENGIYLDEATASLSYTFETDDEPVFLEIKYPTNRIGAYSDDEANNSSIVMKLKYYETVFLLTGDIEKEAESDLININVDLSADVLKVGHHGSDTSSSEEFIKAVSPEYAVIQVGEGNPYGHPSVRTLKRLERSGAKVLRNDELGDIVFEVGKDGIVDIRQYSR